MEQILTNLGIEWPVIIAQSVAFVVLIFVMIKFLFAPVGAIMRQREEQIANSLAGAEAEQVRADSLRQEYEGRLTGIADEARERIEQAMKDAEAARVRMMETTQADIQDLYARHQKQMDLEREQLRRELRTEMSDIAVMAATKALRNQITPEIHSAVMDQVVRELDQMPTQSM